MSQHRHYPTRDLNNLPKSVAAAMENAGLEIVVRSRVAFINKRPTVVIEMPCPGSKKNRQATIAELRRVLADYCATHPKCAAARIRPFIDIKKLPTCSA